MIRVVLGVIGNDIHVVAIKLLEIALRDYGFRVFNLGVSTKPVEFADAVVETGSQLLMISSLNGEAANWARNIRSMLNNRNYPECVMAIGGNLSVGEAKEEDIINKFKGYGFDYVFYQKEIEESLMVIRNHFNNRPE
jgi:methylaspartate mutase sigma subunit